MPMPLSSRRLRTAPKLQAASAAASLGTPSPVSLSNATIQRAQDDPQRLQPREVLGLQRSMGNRAVQRLLDGANHPAERAAEDVAQRVASGSAPRMPQGDSGFALDRATEQAIQQQRGGGLPLGAAARGKMEGALGVNLDHVRIHTDTRADSLSRSLDAKAFTVGSDIFFKRGVYDPVSSNGSHLLAHELTHVVQQGGGHSPFIQRIGDEELRSKIGAKKYGKVKAAGKLAYFCSLDDNALESYRLMPNTEFEQKLPNLSSKALVNKGPQKSTQVTKTKSAPPQKPKVEPAPDVDPEQIREWIAKDFEDNYFKPYLIQFDKVDVNDETAMIDFLDGLTVHVIMTLIQEAMLRRTENFKKLLDKLQGAMATAYTLDQKKVQAKLVHIFTDLARVVPTIKDFSEDKDIGTQIDESKDLATTRRRFMDEQRTAAGDVTNPSLKLNETVTIDGYKVLQWYDEINRSALSQFYDDTSGPARSIDKRGRGRTKQEDLTLGKDKWLDTWAQLAWKDKYVGEEDRNYGRAKKGIYPLIGSVTAGTHKFNVEDKLWVKEGTGKATRYNVMGDSLNVGKTAPQRATGIRNVLSGNFGGVDKLEVEAAMAMFGAETARNPRSYGIGMMLLDLVEDEATYGSGKKYDWSKILGSSPHTGESNREFESRKTSTSLEKQTRWKNMKDAIDLHTPQFKDKPFKSLWAGKWSMSPSASMTLGSPKIGIPNSTVKLNTVQYKELKTILNWYIHFMKGAKLMVKDESEAKTSLQTLFRKRLTLTAKLTQLGMKRTMGV